VTAASDILRFMTAGPDAAPEAETSDAPEASGAAIAADRRRVEQLYVRLEVKLTNVVVRWLWNREEARDVLQEAFVRLWRMRARIDWERVEPLVFRIALNLAANRRRSRRLWQFVTPSCASTGSGETIWKHHALPLAAPAWSRPNRISAR
jgi:DNA-directed RNA polymerase specialized sigma24 family protein